MKITIAESDPYMELCTPQAFCFSPNVLARKQHVASNNNVNSFRSGPSADVNTHAKIKASDSVNVHAKIKASASVNIHAKISFHRHSTLLMAYLRAEDLSRLGGSFTGWKCYILSLTQEVTFENIFGYKISIK